MKKLLVLTLIFLCSCEHSPRQTMPSDDALVLPSPKPIVSQSQFVQLFTDLCLVSPTKLPDFEKTAKRFGLAQSRRSDRLRSVYDVYEWRSPKEHEDSALEISVGWGDIIYEVEDSPSGLAARQRFCTIKAYLPELTEENRNQLKHMANEELLPLAKALDFNVYTDSYSVTSDDIGLKLTPSEKILRVPLKPEPGCTSENPCWSVRPYSLSIRAIIERLP